MPVVIAGRRPDALATTSALIEAAGGQSVSCILDVTDTAHAKQLLETAETAFGAPWAVFANAGRGLDRPAHLTSAAELRELFEVNFFAAHELLTAAAARMVARGQGGHLIGCASCVSKFSPPYHGAYSATKAAQDLFCQAMRLELAPAGVHVSTVHPITTVTDFFDVSAEASGRAGTRSGIDHTPRLFRQTPERVAAAIVKCLQRPVPEVWTSRLVRLSAALRTLRPRLMDRQMRRMLDADRLHSD